jgi:hypothetical protein
MSKVTTIGDKLGVLDIQLNTTEDEIVDQLVEFYIYLQRTTGFSTNAWDLFADFFKLPDNIDSKLRAKIRG